jgi:hypothetical protein
MYCTKLTYTRQLIALLLVAIMMLVHVAKALHTHASYNSDHSCKQESILTKGGVLHGHCSICEFQLAKDATFSGEVVLVIAPVYTAPTYTRLITAINPNRLFISESRGPPQA